MLLYVLSWLLHSILATAEDNNLTLVGFVTTQAICPLDPFVNLRMHATPKQSDPICCLIPPSSEDSTSTDEFLSFEEWKSRLRELEDRSSQTQTSNQTSHADSSSPKPPDNDSTTILTPPLGDTDSILDLTPTQLPHFRVPLTDRFNYASSECSARIRSSHPSSRSPSSLLSSKKDKYMLSPCSVQPNYVVVELCDDIRIDTVQLANFEYFSGVFRDFKVSVAQTYTNDDQAWVEAGTYRAKNVRGVQSFHPLVDLRPFYRYVRIDFLSYYGSEYYCPISLLRVYGLTQLEEWKWELWQSNSEPTLPQSNGLFNTVAQQIMELQNVSISNTSAPSIPDPSQDLSAGSKEILVPVTRTESAADLNVTNKDTEVFPTSTTSLPVSSTASVIPSTDSAPNPASSPNSSISYSPHSIIHTANTSVSSPSSSGSSVPASGSGDSIFRTIMNRLNMLEANTTLYHKYVEEQTLRLRDALRKLEEDVGRLEGLNKNQQQIFFKTVQELDRHRRQMENERSILLERVDQLADEIILEKRLGIAQLCLLLTVLIFMTLTRGSRTNITTLFGGATHHHPRWSSVDLSDSFARPRSKTPVPNGAGKKGRVRSHSTTNSSTPKATPRTPPRRDSYTISAQRSDANNVSNNERPTYRLYRSNSNTTSVTTPSSAKRLAQTAHLHDISVLKRPKPRIPEDRTSSELNLKPLRLKKPSGGINGIYTADSNLSTADKTNDSWIDTEPGSGASDND